MAKNDNDNDRDDTPNKAESKTRQKTLDIKAWSIVGNMVFSQKEIWAYYSLPTTIYDFMSRDKKMGTLALTTNGLVALIDGMGGDRVVPGHIIVTNTPVDVDQWEDDYLNASASWHRPAGFDRFIQEQVAFLKSKAYLTKRVYLGIKLGDRFAVDWHKMLPTEVGWDQAKAYAKYCMDNLLMTDDKSVAEDEIQTSRVTERTINDIITSGNLQGYRASAEELALVIKRTFYPAMPTPYLQISPGDRWGRGDLIREFGGTVHKAAKWVKCDHIINGEEMTGYRATITFRKFPSLMTPPDQEPWLTVASALTDISMPFDLSARFDLIPNKVIKKKINKTKADIKDELKNVYQSNNTPSQNQVEEFNEMEDLDNLTDKDTSPWMDGTYRMAVFAPDVATLKKYVSSIVQKYKDLGIETAWTSGDQIDLMLEFMPGDVIRDKSFMQTSTIQMLGASGFDIMAQVGD